MKLFRNTFALFGGIAAVAALALIMGATGGGFPSRPVFQTVRVIAPGTVSAPNVEISNTNPNFQINDTNSAANNRLWEIFAGATTLTHRIVDDARASATDWMIVTRSGLGLTSVNFPNGTLQSGGVAVARQSVGTSNPSAASIGIGDTFTVIKTADTARSSTVTLANDPDLTITNIPAGRYHYRVYVQTDGTTTGTQGIGWNINYSGTFTSPASHWNGYHHCSGAMQTGGAALAAAVTTLQRTCADLNTTDSDNMLELVGTLVATGTGTLGFSWAQEASSANATNVRDGSHIALTRLQ